MSQDEGSQEGGPRRWRNYDDDFDELIGVEMPAPPPSPPPPPPAPQPRFHIRNGFVSITQDILARRSVQLGGPYVDFAVNMANLFHPQRVNRRRRYDPGNPPRVNMCALIDNSISTIHPLSLS